MGEDGKPADTTHRVERDEGLRDTTLEALAGLRTNLPDGIHPTAEGQARVAENVVPSLEPMVRALPAP